MPRADVAAQNRRDFATRNEDVMLEFLKREGIDRFAFCPFSRARITLERKLQPLREQWGGDPETVMVFLAPYSLGEAEEGNISVYARSRDYHLYFEEVGRRLKAYAATGAIEGELALFGDNSPVDEVELAYRCGLGVKGDHGLLIDPVYGSYVFIGEVFFQKDPGLPHAPLGGVKECLHCSACVKACPVGCAGTSDRSRCLSLLSQKKKLSSEEEALLREHPTLWGCDLCQDACPMNRRAASTPLAFFREDRTPFLSEKLLRELEQTGRFEERAFSWRGKDVLLRNLSLTL